jgi:carbon monoxide dehydrogenase subunit G
LRLVEGYERSMFTVERSFTVTAPADVVVDYLSDFGHAEEWDPGTQRCTRNDAGPIAPGARWHHVSKVLGVTTELTYTLKELNTDTIVLVGTNAGATSTDTITVRPNGAGSRLTYHVDLEMHGISKLAAPVMKREMEKLGTETESQMTRVLNRLPAR